MHAKGLCKKHYQVQRVLLRPEAFKTYQKRSRDNHKEKRKETARLWAEKNRDRVKETARAWSKTSEGRAKIRAQVARRRACRLGLKHPDVPDALRTFCCALCGSPPPSAVDHILPLSWAGHSPEANACLEDPACYQPLCKSCNSTKSNRYVWALVPTGDIGDP